MGNSEGAFMGSGGGVWIGLKLGTFILSLLVLILWVKKLSVDRNIFGLALGDTYEMEDGTRWGPDGEVMGNTLGAVDRSKLGGDEVSDIISLYRYFYGTKYENI